MNALNLNIFTIVLNIQMLLILAAIQTSFHAIKALDEKSALKFYRFLTYPESKNYVKYIYSNRKTFTNLYD